MKLTVEFALKWFRVIPSQGGIFQKVMILAGGTALAQGLLFLVSPILTRLYSPHDFGMLAVYMSIVTLLSVVSSLRYELAIPIAEDGAEAVSLLMLSMGVIVAFCMVVGGALLIFGNSLTAALQLEPVTHHLWLAVVSIFGIGTYQTLNFYALRQKSYSLIASTKISQGVGQAAVQTGLGVLHAGGFGLMAGDAIGRMGGSGKLAVSIFRKDRHLLKQVTFASIFAAARRHRRFPLINSGAAFLNNAGLQLAPLLFSALYGPQVAGWFLLCERVIGAPMSLVGKSVEQVFFGEGAALAREDAGKFRRFFYNTVLKLLAGGALPIVCLAILGPWLFTELFGPQWSESGHYARMMSVMFLVQFIVVPLGRTLIMMEKHSWQLAWDAARLCLVAAGLCAAYLWRLSATEAIAIYSFTMLTAYVALFLMSAAAVRGRAGKRSGSGEYPGERGVEASDAVS